MFNYNSPVQQTEIKTLGRYRLQRLIGKGGMGEVWLGEDPVLHRQVAIKTLPMHNLSDREFSQRFEREAQAAASLNHPHILPVHDYGQQILSNGQVITYIVLPYITGGSLSDRIAAYSARGIPMFPQEAILYLSQAAEAIDYAHEQGIIHRDIKPGNMLLRSDNWLMLADFGIACILASSEQLTQQGIGVGTPEYMAPEQAQSKAEFASDNYSLAVIAYQLFTGQLPFQADTGYAITIQHMTMPPPPPRQINPHLSPAVEIVLLRGLAKQPGGRYSDCRQFVRELQLALSGASYENTYVKPTVHQTSGPNTATNQSNQQGQAYSEPLSVVSVGMKGLITRRRVLIGGVVAAGVVLGSSGLAYWLVTHFRPVPLTLPNPSPTPLSGGPLLIQGKHNKPVATLAFSPTGESILASAGEGDDGLVYLWDVPTLFHGEESAAAGESLASNPKCGCYVTGLVSPRRYACHW
jgi:serine/threonine protein kinase